MPRGKRKPVTASSPGADARRRIKEAEAANAGQIVERIAITEETLNRVADLVEWGEGTKINVLRTALSIGVKAMHGKRAYNVPTVSPYPQPSARQVYPQIAPFEPEATEPEPFFDVRAWDGHPMVDPFPSSRQLAVGKLDPVIASMPAPPVEETGIDAEDVYANAE